MAVVHNPVDHANAALYRLGQLMGTKRRFERDVSYSITKVSNIIMEHEREERDEPFTNARREFQELVAVTESATKKNMLAELLRKDVAVQANTYIETAVRSNSLTAEITENEATNSKADSTGRLSDEISLCH